MAPSPSPAEAGSRSQSVSASQASELLTSFTHFLIVSIHNILFYRSLYPAETFLTARAFNLPVHQSRHPKVCSWITDSVDAVKAQLALGGVERIAVVIYDKQSNVMERWVFDVAQFPAWRGVKDSTASRPENPDEVGDGDAEAAGGSGTVDDSINWTDLDEQYRAALRKIAYAGEKITPVPEGCSFTIAVELRDQAEAPIGHPQPWIPSQPNLQPRSQGHGHVGSDIGGAKTTPIRAVEAGPLFFECWVEEGAAKVDQASGSSSHS